jgi:hypothetical protein
MLIQEANPRYALMLQLILCLLVLDIIRRHVWQNIRNKGRDLVVETTIIGISSVGLLLAEGAGIFILINSGSPIIIH